MKKEQLSQILKPLEWMSANDADKIAETNLWYDFLMERSMGIYSLLKMDITGETILVEGGIKTLEEGYKLAWEEYVDDVMSMF
jgi:hypothetical protein|nr:MAG TPA: hypothetical protein [Crassvirales sp.]